MFKTPHVKSRLPARFLSAGSEHSGHCAQGRAKGAAAHHHQERENLAAVERAYSGTENILMLLQYYKPIFDVFTVLQTVPTT